MIYKAFLDSVDENIEEEINLVINNIKFTGFINILPYELKVGLSYNVYTSFFTLDDVVPKELVEPTKEIIKVEKDRYPYILRGLLKENGNLDVGFEINDDDDILKEYKYLYNKYIEIKIDRISVNFLDYE